MININNFLFNHNYINVNDPSDQKVIEYFKWHIFKSISLVDVQIPTMMYNGEIFKHAICKLGSIYIVLKVITLNKDFSSIVNIVGF